MNILVYNVAEADNVLCAASAATVLALLLPFSTLVAKIVFSILSLSRCRKEPLEAIYGWGHFHAITHIYCTIYIFDHIHA